ncbi:hypothetical protein [Sphingomonas oligoaromativorans]|uniref:hypothetical protein n=1 Tax=Sphingomonas oligoaromativorans TaxID=575322 RepID=UPI0014241542|nr:hypothetical protein [Sphingomonas oligoaromativorans]NIJ32490.1 hypothetical protein [Sphingomonas oligoaromativorans]
MHLETLGGAVSYQRLRGSQVHSLSTRAFAVESISNIPARLATGGLVFSEAGVGVFPVAVIADSVKQALDAMKKSDVPIYIEQKGALMEAGFSICGKIVPNFTEVPPLRIYDADKILIKRIGGFFIDTVGNALQSMDALITFRDNGMGGTIREAVTKLPETFETYGESRRPFGSPPKSAAKAGVIISMYDTGGCMNSRRKAIAIAELGQLLMRRFT